MDWSQVGSLIAPMAPTIGGILGGFIPFPGGQILGTLAGKMVATALGVPPTPEAVHAAVTTGDPDVIKAKLAAADSEMNAEVEKFKAQLEDVQDARATTVKLDAVGSSIAWGSPVISMMVVAGFITVLFFFIARPVTLDAVQATALNILLGSLGAAFTQVCNYWLGSSAGSQDKSNQIAQMATTAAAVSAKAAAKK